MKGSELREERHRLGLSQHALGAALAVPWNTIARWERSEMAIAHPEILRRALRDLERDLRQEQARADEFQSA